MSEPTQKLIQNLRDAGLDDAVDYIANLTEKEKQRIEFRESENLISSFIWGQTPQGYSYWNQTNDRFQKLWQNLRIKKMEWTKDRPKIPGFYWLRRKGEIDQVTEVYSIESEELWAILSDSRHVRVVNVNGEWSDVAIPLPEENK